MLKKSPPYVTMLTILAVASLFAFLGYSVFPSSGSVAAAAFLQDETPTPTPTPTPAPTLIIVKEVSPDLVNDLDGDEVIDPGDTIKYIITYENIGDAEATKVTIVDDYDQDYIDSIANISAEGRDDEDTITWNLGTVEAGAKGSVTYEAKLDISFPGGSIDVVNTATIDSDETEPVMATESTPVEGPILTIDKKVAAVLVKDLDLDGVIDPGDTIKYIITYENIGDGQATEVTIVDDYDQTLVAEIPSISAGGVKDEDTITWNLGTVEAGAKASASYNATLKSVFPPGSTNVENTAIISSDGVESASDEATVLVEVIPTPTPAPTLTPAPTAAPTPSTLEVKETRAQGEGPLNNIQITILLALLLIGGLVVVGFMAFQTLTSDQAAKDREYIRCLIEGVILVVIFFTIIVLALHNAMERDGVISIVSAIVGYMLGRRAAR
jgi:uncharacterized repeat protein (TIGR01451 family)